jgi:hypothetical protein
MQNVVLVLIYAMIVVLLKIAATASFVTSNENGKSKFSRQMNKRAGKL